MENPQEPNKKTKKKSAAPKAKKPAVPRKEDQISQETIDLARKALAVIRATDPQTLDDLPVKMYTPEEIHKLMSIHAGSLSEHADTVQIFLTTQQGGKTSSYYFGLGNHYARAGQIQDWIATTLGGGMPSDDSDDFDDLDDC